MKKQNTFDGIGKLFVIFLVVLLICVFVTKRQDNQENPTEYYEGDVMECGDLRIKIKSTDSNYTDYEDTYGFYEPTKGMKYVYAEFIFKNIGKNKESVNVYDFDCYADGVLMEQTYLFSDFVIGSISPDRSVTVIATFEVPISAKNIEMEYELNSFLKEKAIIIIE